MDAECSAEMIVPSQVALHCSAGLLCEDFLPPDLASIFMTPVPIREDVPDEIPRVCHQLRREDEDVLVSCL